MCGFLNEKMTLMTFCECGGLDQQGRLCLVSVTSFAQACLGLHSHMCHKGALLAYMISIQRIRKREK